MSLITHCPACGTTFKVVSDQLKISDGWVRCGQCAEVFDTATTLRRLDLTEVASSSGGIAVPSVKVHGLNDALLPMVGAGGGDLSPSQVPVSVSSIVEEDDYVSPLVPDILLDDTPPVSDSSVDVDVDLIAPGEAEKGAFPRSLTDGMQAFEREQMLLETQPKAIENAHLSFMTKAVAMSRWQTAGARVALWVMGFVLLLSLMGQAVIHERDRIASVEPQLKPVLMHLCGVLQCQIRPFRHIEAMTVDASSFNKQRGDVYRLSFVVKNTANIALARPAIELTLTDNQDMPLLRRVLLPGELSAKADGRGNGNTDVEPMAGGSEWVGSYLVSIASPAEAPSLSKAVSGYRILAFYP